MGTIDFDELISYYAKRGDTEMLTALRKIQEDIEQEEDPDYETESETESESESESETESGGANFIYSSSDSEVELDDHGCVPEQVEINPSMNGFCSIV